PVNTMRLDKKTPCAKTSFCADCKSPDRICNMVTRRRRSMGVPTMTRSQGVLLIVSSRSRIWSSP
ncbi:MAG: hypothetical protein P8129_07715, partial [Anaerolineae bacterium]